MVSGSNPGPRLGETRRSRSSKLLAVHQILNVELYAVFLRETSHLSSKSLSTASAAVTRSVPEIASRPMAIASTDVGFSLGNAEALLATSSALLQTCCGSLSAVAIWSCVVSSHKAVGRSELTDIQPYREFPLSTVNWAPIGWKWRSSLVASVGSADLFYGQLRKR